MVKECGKSKHTCWTMRDENGIAWLRLGTLKFSGFREGGGAEWARCPLCGEEKWEFHTVLGCGEK
jgi:hypothetical protein